MSCMQEHLMLRYTKCEQEMVGIKAMGETIRPYSKRRLVMGTRLLLPVESHRPSELGML
jgi:hypothetical protein